jgi:hypothetical protein
MRALIKWVAASALLGGGVVGAGCMAVTGVGDYEACKQSSIVDCANCCGTAFPDAKFQSLEDLRNCACNPDTGPCRSECSVSADGGDPFCHDPLANVTVACDNCLANAIRGGHCLIDHTNDYNLCLGGCPAATGGSSGG